MSKPVKFLKINNKIGEFPEFDDLKVVGLRGEAE